MTPSEYDPDTIIERARREPAFRDGLLAAAAIARANDTHAEGPPCPATMAAVYIERYAEGERP